MPTLIRDPADDNFSLAKPIILGLYAFRRPPAGEDRMLRWLPRNLVRAYKAWAEARAYARSTRIKPIAEEAAAKPCGSDRLHRLNIVQDARCEHRPLPRKLFRNPQAPRDTTSWCDRPNAWTGRRKPSLREMRAGPQRVPCREGR